MKEQIPIMNDKEVSEAMGMTIQALFKLCHDNEDLLRLVITVAVQNGILKGRMQAGLSYNKMFRSYDPASLQN